LFLFYKELKLFTVDPNYAQTIGMPVKSCIMGFYYSYLLLVVGIQAVGTVLTNALLVILWQPEALTDRLGIMIALSCIFRGIIRYRGIYLSYYFGSASGASIVMLRL